jgi:hypothetical protein
MNEPAYIAQTKLGAAEENKAWVDAQGSSSFERGCTFSRVSLDKERGLILFEAWHEVPDEDSEPRWLPTDAPTPSAP